MIGINIWLLKSYWSNNPDELTGDLSHSIYNELDSEYYSKQTEDDNDKVLEESLELGRPYTDDLTIKILQNRFKRKKRC